MTPSPLVWIIILNWNGLADTLTCLESLRQLHYAHRKIVVVDNGSTDGSVAALRRAASSSEFELIEAGCNLGYAGGNNLGIRRALRHGVDFVLVLNNDTTVDPKLLDELIAAAGRYPNAGCFGPWIYYIGDRERLWFTRSEWDPSVSAFTAPDKGRLGSEVSREPVRSEYVCGAALFFRAGVARQIGLFDERFFLVYEDSDWCFRARRAGFECVTVPSARVWHKVATSFASEASPLRTYFSTRNKLLWAETNLSRRGWWQIVRGALRRVWPIPRIDRAAAGSIPRALLWAVSGFRRDWARKRADPLETAHRRGVLDYLLRRFGDCPPTIRQLSEVWAEARLYARAPGGGDSAAPRH
jgi:GT2 family glycosyltransferase